VPPSSSSSSLIYLLGTHLKIVFNEPLSNSPVGINVDVDPGFNGLTTPSASSTSSSSSSSVNNNKSPLAAILKCNTKSCIKADNTGKDMAAIDGELIWSVDKLDNTNDMYETKNYLTDTVVIQTNLKNGKPGDVIGADTTTTPKLHYGYAIWLSDNIVFDRAGNSYAGSDLDKAIMITILTSSTPWGAIIGGILLALCTGGLFFYLYSKKKNGEDICSCCQPNNDNQSPFSSSSQGGFVNFADDA
jgi:hypothetical protein